MTIRSIAFHSMFGGVGTSTICANFAQHLTNKGHRVIIVDGNIEAPHITYWYPLREKSEAQDVVALLQYLDGGRYWRRIMPEILEKSIFEVSENMFLLPCRSLSIWLEYKVSIFKRLGLSIQRHAAKIQASYILYDLPAGYSDLFACWAIGARLTTLVELYAPHRMPYVATKTLRCFRDKTLQHILLCNKGTTKRPYPRSVYDRYVSVPFVQQLDNAHERSFLAEDGLSKRALGRLFRASAD